MALGNSRPRNWGKEAQQIALEVLCKHRKVAYKVTALKNDCKELSLAASNGAVTLPYAWNCRLENVRRGRWISVSFQDGHEISSGISLRECIRKTITDVWN